MQLSKGLKRMILQPYDTIALKAVAAKKPKLIEQLEVAFIHGDLKPVAYSGTYPSPHVLEILPNVEGIDALVAPLLITTRQGQKVVFDARASRSINREGELGFRSASDYNFTKTEAALIWLWAEGNYDAFKQAGPLAIKIYARWIGRSLARLIALDGLNEIYLIILSGYYYMTQMIPEELNDMRKFAVMGYLARALGVELDLVQRCLQTVNRINDGIELIDTMKRVGSEQQVGYYVRLESLNPLLVYNKLVGGWYGANARTITGAAIEYVPTFLTMLYTAFEDHSYHSSPFTKMVLETDRRHEGRHVVLTVNQLLRGVTDE